MTRALPPVFLFCRIIAMFHTDITFLALPWFSSHWHAWSTMHDAAEEQWRLRLPTALPTPDGALAAVCQRRRRQISLTGHNNVPGCRTHPKQPGMG